MACLTVLAKSCSGRRDHRLQACVRPSMRPCKRHTNLLGLQGESEGVGNNAAMKASALQGFTAIRLKLHGPFVGVNVQ